MDTVVSIVLFFLIFGVIVLGHEYGHYILAKVNGITVVEFAIGMGPTVASFHKNGTKYSLKLLPIGGACMFEGEDGLNMDTASDEKSEEQSGENTVTEEVALQKDAERSGAFPDASVWARISTVVAGPVFNFILGILFAMIMVSVSGTTKAEIISVMDGYPAQEAGLQAGDVITSLNGSKIHLYGEVQLVMALNRDGLPVEVEYERDGQKYETVIVPKMNEETGSYLMGVSGGVYEKPKGIHIVSSAWYEVRYYIKYTFMSLKMLVTGQAGVKDMAGPVGMAQVVDETYTVAKSYGVATVIASMLNISILLTVNLGILNLLPLPALDGGRLLFLIIELIRRKPIPPEKEGMVHFGGFVALMLLMVVVFFNDIMRLFQ